nr:GGDEF domain-containing protein [Nitrospiraceae bacterium]
FIFFSTFLGVTATRITQDISKVNSLVSNLYHDAHHDFLTGLPNRTFVLDSRGDLLAETARTGDHAAILFIDLDGFKAINDRLGHDMGDMAWEETNFLFCSTPVMAGNSRHGSPRG